jgi:prepilin-type N-terminal cleavage/methylation domain-containing protein/prepilin-type processing-associated H-X9-DG protein
MKQHKHAFSLIEVLVVIATISVLMAVLLPSLSITRRIGRRMRCAANLKQLALAWQVYIDVYDGRFYKSLYANNEYGGWRPNPRGDVRPLNRFVNLDPQLRDESQAGLFRCPSDRGGIKDTEPATPTFDLYGTSYETNTYLIGPVRLSTTNDHIRDLHTAMNPKIGPLRISDVDCPHAEVVLMGDYPWWNRSRGYAFNPDLVEFLAWHDKLDTYNVAFLDGHVKFQKIAWPLFKSGEYTVIPFKEFYPLASEARQTIMQNKDP